MVESEQAFERNGSGVHKNTVSAIEEKGCLGSGRKLSFISQT
jgi:hypothetical protein